MREMIQDVAEETMEDAVDFLEMTIGGGTMLLRDVRGRMDWVGRKAQVITEGGIARVMEALASGPEQDGEDSLYV